MVWQGWPAPPAIATLPCPATWWRSARWAFSGELRSVSQMERRLAEAERLGFARCLLPQAALRRGAPASGMQLIPAASLREAIRLAFA